MWHRLIKFLKKNERYIYLEYGVLGLLILGPLLAKGYVFAMDLPGPRIFPWPAEISHFYLLDVTLFSFAKIAPSWLIQKIVLFLIILLAAVGAHKLVPTKYQWPKYFAGLLYILTPFFYSRFLFGQTWFLVAYALTPFLVRRLLLFLKEQNLKSLLWFLLWSVLVSIFSLQHVFFLGLLFGLGFLFFLIWILVKKEYLKLKKLFLYSLIFMVLFLIVNSYWLLPFLQGRSSSAQVIDNFSAVQSQAFQTQDGGSNVFFNVLAMYGFWGDKTGVYVLPKNINPVWWLFLGLIWLIVLWGIVTGFRQKKIASTLIFFILMIAALILAVGVAYKPLIPLVEWLNIHVPFYQGFREPQKFGALIVLGYCFFGSRGLSDLSERLKKIKKEWLAVVALLLVIFYNPLAFNGFRGQLFVSDFPPSWYALDEEFQAQENDFKVLFLPWHQYMSFNFARNKVLANPAEYFFHQPIISGDNIELGGITNYNQRPFSKFFENDILQNKNSIRNLGAQLKNWNVKYILLAKEVDWAEYDFLNQQSDLQLIKTYSDLLVYENKKY